MPKFSELNTVAFSQLSDLDRFCMSDVNNVGALSSVGVTIGEFKKFIKQNTILSGNSFPTQPVTNQYFNLLQDVTLLGTDYKAGLYFFNVSWQNVFTAGSDTKNEFDIALQSSDLPASPNDLDIILVEATFSASNRNNANFSFEKGFFYKYRTSLTPTGWYKVGTQAIPFADDLPDQMEIVKGTVTPVGASNQGKIWWDTGNNALKYFNGTTWVSFFTMGQVSIPNQSIDDTKIKRDMTNTQKANFRSYLGITEGQELHFADELDDLPVNVNAGDVLISFANFQQSRTRPDGSTQHYNFLKGGIYHYFLQDTPNNQPAGFFSATNKRLALTEDLVTLRTAVQTARLLETLTGTDRLDYTDLKNLPTIPSLRTANETARLIETLTGDTRLSYTSLKNVPTIPSVMNLTATNLKQNMTEAEKNSFNSVIGSLRKVGNTDLKVLNNAEQLDFQRQIGVENIPAPDPVFSATELVVNPLSPFKLGELKIMEARFSISRTTLGDANVGKDLDLSIASFFDSLDIETVFGSPSRIYVAHGASSVTALTVTQDVNGNDTLGNVLNDAIVLDGDKNSFVLRGDSFGSSRVLMNDDGVGNSIEVYYTSSTKPAGATNNWERTITVTSGGGNLRGFCCDEERDILYVMPSVGNTILAYKFSTGTAMASENIALTHASSPAVNDLIFHKGCILVQDRIGQQVYVYDSLTKKYSPKNSFVFRSSNDEFNTAVKYSNTLYSYIYENEFLYSYKLGEFQGAYSEEELGTSILIYRYTGFEPIFGNFQKVISSATTPVNNVQEEDIWIDNSDPESLKAYYRINQRWIALAPDKKLKTLSASMDGVDTQSALKKLGLASEFEYSDDANNLEYDRNYILSEIASNTPVAHQRFIVTSSGTKQVAFSLDRADTYYRLENSNYQNYTDPVDVTLTPVQRFSNSEISQDTIKLYRGTTTGAPFGQSGLIYGTILVIAGETRFYQVALTPNRLFYRYNTNDNELRNTTWIEGEPDELFKEDISTIANFNSQIWLIRQGRQGDSDKVPTTYLRVFQRTISSGIVTETLYYPQLANPSLVESGSNAMGVKKVSRIKSERFNLSNWVKDYGQLVPSDANHPPNIDRIWHDTTNNSLKKYITETAVRGVRNESTEFDVSLTGVITGFLKDDANRNYYIGEASGSSRNLRAYTFLGERDSSQDINIGLQNNSFLCTGGAFDPLNQRVLAVDGNNLSTTRRVYAYSHVDRSYTSSGNIELHSISRYNLFYGGFALRSVGSIKRVGNAGALGSMNGLAFNPLTGELFSVSNSQRNIYRVNQTTGVALRIGNAGALAGSGGFYSLAVVNNQIYTINNSTNTLLRVSLTDGRGTIIKQSGLATRSWASLTGHKNKLYAIANGTVKELYEISPSEGTSRLIGILPSGNYECLSSDGENLFTINSDDDQLYIVSEINGSVRAISEEQFLLSGRYTGLAYNPVSRKFLTNNGTSLYEVDTSNVGKLYLLGRHTGDSTRHEIVVFSLNSETYGQQLTDETIVLSGATDPTSIASNGEHIHVLDRVSNVYGIKGFTFAGARDTSKDITLHDDNNTSANGIIFNEGLINVFDNTTNERKVFSYTDSNTISYWASIISAGDINTAMLQDRLITSAKIGLLQVLNEHLADNSVATRNIQNGNVTNPKLGNGSVNHRTMATNAIENENILSGTVGLEKLAVDGFPRSAIGITDDGQSLAYRHFPYLDKRTIEELPDIDSNDRDFYLPILAGPSFTHGSTVSSASTSVQGFHQALAIDRYGTIAEFWRTSNATGQGHIRLSSIHGGGHADHTVSSFNNSTHIHMQSDGDYWWLMEFSNNEFKLHRLNSKAFYPLNSFTLSSSLFSTLFSSNASNFRGFAFMTPNTIIDGHGFSEIVLATPNSAHILAFNTTNGFGASQHTIGLETLANITDCQGVAIAGRGHSHAFFVDSPSTEACKAFSTLDNSRVSGLDFTFSNAGTTRVALAGYRDFLLNSWTNNNLSTGQVDGDQLVKKLRVNGNNKLIRTNSSGALVTGDVS